MLAAWHDVNSTSWVLVLVVGMAHMVLCNHAAQEGFLCMQFHVQQSARPAQMCIPGITSLALTAAVPAAAFWHGSACMLELVQETLPHATSAACCAPDMQKQQRLSCHC